MSLTAWPKWCRPYQHCAACRGAGCDRCEGNHQNDHLRAFPDGAFAKYLAIAANPLVLVAAIAADPAGVSELAEQARAETDAALSAEVEL